MKIANSAILLQHLLMSTEALKEKCTPAEIHTMGFLKKREIIPLNHFIQRSLDFSLKCLNRKKFSFIRQNHFFSSNHSNTVISRSMVTWRKIDLCALSEIWFPCARCGFVMFSPNPYVTKSFWILRRKFSLNISICYYLFLNMTSERALFQLDSSKLYREEWRQLAEMNKVII